ncbi:unnamed protein product [Caenorhabditis auriculariae]|uniref:F-actin-capping protein subunit alpha n=1 Tax=Caenorhabditis auriculariae TaxID=2777116 RepID=A0A8S1HTA3_9PELO|nr:unnamed protein product [Caenorhabditis auriculariae]
MADVEISDAEKVRIASDFIKHAPPGEFNEVFNSVRMLLKNDHLLKDKCVEAISQYNVNQFVPVKLEGVEKQTLITPYNDLGNGRFYDEVSRKSFKYDHMRKEASDVQPHQSEGGINEQWRAALQKELDHYVDEHYSKSGVGVCFARNGSFNICIESHQFQPKNFCNGRWRSEWNVPVGEGKSGSQELKGRILSQVHYYEDGNVQLFSDKEPLIKVQISADIEKTAKDVLHAICDEEAKYQNAIQENYACMSDTTFKALRRQLPVTRAKMDWNKVPTYRIGQEMK